MLVNAKLWLNNRQLLLQLLASDAIAALQERPQFHSCGLRQVSTWAGEAVSLLQPWHCLQVSAKKPSHSCGAVQGSALAREAMSSAAVALYAAAALPAVPPATIAHELALGLFISSIGSAPNVRLITQSGMSSQP